MHPKKQIIVGDRTFDTQKQLEDYIRGLLQAIGVCKSVKAKGERPFNDLVDVLQRHPDSERKLERLSDIAIVKNVMNARAYEVHVVRDDGTSVDISWKLCVSGKPKTHKLLLRTAMRTSIQPQINDFRMGLPRSELFTCMLCQHPTRGIVHIDHVIHFDKLADDFVRVVTDEIPTTFADSSDGTNRAVFKPEDSAFELKWQAYHHKHAVLRALCPTCNLKREKYKE